MGTHVIVYVRLSFSASVAVTVNTVVPRAANVETSVAAETLNMYVLIISCNPKGCKLHREWHTFCLMPDTPIVGWWEKAVDHFRLRRLNHVARLVKVAMAVLYLHVVSLVIYLRSIAKHVILDNISTNRFCSNIIFILYFTVVNNDKTNLASL